MEASPVGDPTGIAEHAFIGEPTGGPPEAPKAPHGKNTAGLGCSMGEVLMMPGHTGGAAGGPAFAGPGPTGGALHGKPISATVTTEPGSGVCCAPGAGTETLPVVASRGDCRRFCVTGRRRLGVAGEIGDAVSLKGEAESHRS